MQGWKLTFSLSAALIGLTVLQLLVWGGDEPGIRVVVRSTARTSLVLFGLAFAASSLHVLSRGAATRWILANRRYLGVSYAASHALHALALLALARASAEFASSVDTLTLVGGGLAYAFTFAMAVTSNDASVAALGRRRWRLLHLVGGWYIWIIFAQSYLPRALQDPAYGPGAALVLAVAGLRLAVRLRRPARASS